MVNSVIVYVITSINPLTSISKYAHDACIHPLPCQTPGPSRQHHLPRLSLQPPKLSPSLCPHFPTVHFRHNSQRDLLKCRADVAPLLTLHSCPAPQSESRGLHSGPQGQAGPHGLWPPALIADITSFLLPLFRLHWHLAGILLFFQHARHTPASGPRAPVASA